MLLLNHLLLFLLWHAKVNTCGTRIFQLHIFYFSLAWHHKNKRAARIRSFFSSFYAAWPVRLAVSFPFRLHAPVQKTHIYKYIKSHSQIYATILPLILYLVV